jgi:hypothetical protein
LPQNLYDPTGTITRVIVGAGLNGIAWAVVAALLIYAGSTWLPPRIARGRVWAEWRRKRMIWGASVMLTAIAAVLLSELVAARIGMVDLYWMARQPALFWIARLAGTCGYLLLMFLMVTTALINRKRQRSAAAPPPTPRNSRHNKA